MKEFWRMLRLLLLWGVIYYGTIFVGAIVVIVGNPNISKEEYIEKLFDSPEFTVTALLGALLIIAIFFGKRYVTLSPGLIERKSARKFLGILALATFSYLFIDGSIMDLPFYHNLFPEEDWQKYEDMKFEFFSLLNLSFAGPITEEIAFRGFFVGKGMKLFPFWLCALVSSAVFAAGHYYPGDAAVVAFDLLFVFIDSVIFSVIYRKTGNCVISATAHLLANTVGLILLFAC